MPKLKDIELGIDSAKLWAQYLRQQLDSFELAVSTGDVFDWCPRAPKAEDFTFLTYPGNVV